jgi:hypothetical protein
MQKSKERWTGGVRGVGRDRNLRFDGIPNFSPARSCRFWIRRPGSVLGKVRVGKKRGDQGHYIGRLEESDLERNPANLIREICSHRLEIRPEEEGDTDRWVPPVSGQKRGREIPLRAGASWAAGRFPAWAESVARGPFLGFFLLFFFFFFFSVFFSDFSITFNFEFQFDSNKFVIFF